MKRFLALACLCLLAFPAEAATLLRLRSGAYDSDAQAYFNALAGNGCATPSAAFKRAVSAYIVAEKAAGNWGNQDAEYIFASADQTGCTQSVNLAQPSFYQITWSGAVTYSLQNGINGDSATGWGDTNAVASTLTRLSQNSSHVEVWSAGGVSSLVSQSAGTVSIFASTSSNNWQTRCTTTATVTDTGAAVGGLGYCDRTDSAHVTTGYNGAVLSNAVASTSTAPPAQHISVCRNGGNFCNSSVNILFAGFGAPMNNEASHYTDVRNLQLALGVTGI